MSDDNAKSIFEAVFWRVLATSFPTAPSEWIDWFERSLGRSLTADEQNQIASAWERTGRRPWKGVLAGNKR